MSGDEPLGDHHAKWHSTEKSLTSNGMGCKKSHILNHNNFNYYISHYGIDKHEKGHMVYK